ncbi:MAG: hypothetical protein Q9173_001207 [Seirophora scorigena]
MALAITSRTLIDFPSPKIPFLVGVQSSESTVALVSSRSLAEMSRREQGDEIGREA